MPIERAELSVDARAHARLNKSVMSIARFIHKLQRHKERGSLGLSRRHPYFWLASYGGSGLLPAGATMASALAVPPALLLFWLGEATLLFTATCAVFWVGTLAANWVEHTSHTHDASMIVADEVAGQWLTLCALPLMGISLFSPLWLLLAFLAFRFTDIAKLPPTNWIDRHIGGGIGVMLDDIVAALQAILVLYLLNAYVFN